MANEIISPNMSLPVPGVGSTLGPTYANDVNTSLDIIDSHTHAPGSGVPITPSGLNINSDLTMAGNNLIGIRSLRLTSQVSPLSGGGADIGCLYESGVDLYFNDGSGNQVRITQSGGVAGSPGSISNLNSPASAAFVAASASFVWQSGSSVAANMDAATYVLRYPGSYPTPAGNYIALQAASALATGYALTFPATTPATLGAWLTSTTSGVLSWTNVDNSTLQYSSNVVSIKASGVGTTQIADGAVTGPKLAAANYEPSSSCGTFTTSSSSFVDVTNLTVTIVTTGRPVVITLRSDGTGAASYVGVSAGTVAGTAAFRILQDGSEIAQHFVSCAGAGDSSVSTFVPSSSLNTFVGGSGTSHTYKVQAKALSGSFSETAYVINAQLVAYEL